MYEQRADLFPINLTCEYKVDPLGIESGAPRLSWEISSYDRGAAQGAYRVIVSSTPQLLAQSQGDLWDPGRIDANGSLFIAYKGSILRSATTSFWKVKVWGKDGEESAWSHSATWTMGLLATEEWKGRWISDGTVRNLRNGFFTAPWNGHEYEKFDRSFLPSPYLRKEFYTGKDVKKVLAFVSALGLYEMYVNGSRVGCDHFTPGWSQYDKRVFYQAYDITPFVKSSAANAVGSIIGDGWYILRHHGSKLGFMLQVEVEYGDGSRQQVVTDKSWKYFADGPVRSSDLFDGETFDARKLQALVGWSEPGFDDRTWQPVEVLGPLGASLSAYLSLPIRQMETLTPISTSVSAQKTHIIDFGQNFAGWVRIKVKGRRGDEIRLKFAEAVNPDGSLFRDNLRGAQCIDNYILGGENWEHWQPHFTYHGFRYVEVECRPEVIADAEFAGVVMHSDVGRVGTFESSNALINRIYSNILWSQRSNYFEVPTDCPQRDERMGWTGDAQVFLKTGIYSMQSGPFFTQWLRSLDDVQNGEGAYPDFAPLHDLYGTAGWADAAIICPWTLYQMYGDKAIIESRFDKMVLYIEFLHGQSINFRRPPCCWPGDWLNVDAPMAEDVVTDMFFAHSTELLSKMADVIGRTAEAEKYAGRAKNIKRAFCDTYLAPDDVIKGDTQSTYVMALAFDLVPVEKRAGIFQRLLTKLEERSYHLSTGFLGIKYLLPVLTEFGRSDLAYRLLLNETFPSWGYNIEHGATTIWESWDAWKSGGGWKDFSLNHFNYGAVGEWFFSSIAGIDLGAPGFEQIVIRPRRFGALSWARASFHSLRGTIASAWHEDASDQSFHLSTIIPANSEAAVYVPILAPERPAISESGFDLAKDGRFRSSPDGVEFMEIRDAHAVFRVTSGSFTFVSK